MVIKTIATTSAALLMFLSLAGPARAAEGRRAGHASHRAGSTATVAAATPAVDIVRDPSAVPPPAGDRPPGIVRFTLTAREVDGVLDPASGTSYRYWTFDGTVPGPMLRVRQDDTVEVTIRNGSGNHMPHSIDLHAAIGLGGGAELTQVVPGQSATFTFIATTPGLFVYHCGTQMVAEHISNGMYGLILVEPPGGLPHADREYYVMQGELYTTAPIGTAGPQQFAMQKLLDERPEYLVYNGAVGALMNAHPMKAQTGDVVRIFFGNAGPNLTSSPHVMGEIFTKLYQYGSLTAPPFTDVQTATVPPGGAAIIELKALMPGGFGLVDHAIARAAKGLMAHVMVTGEAAQQLIHEGPADGTVPSAAASDSAAHTDHH